MGVVFLGKDSATTHCYLLGPSSSAKKLKLIGTAVNTKSFQNSEHKC